MLEFTPKNILVTGGAGFIGSHFVRRLLQAYKDITVINLDALTYAGSMENISDLDIFSNYQLIVGNIIDRALVEDIFSQYSIDTVVHFAAESHVDRSIADPSQFIQTNILGTFTLIDTARQVWKKQYDLDPACCRFHHISTDEVFGSLDKNDHAFSESSPYNPSSPYSASKASADFLVRSYHHTYNVPYTLSNCSNNFGPFQHAEKFIPTVIRQCIQQRPIPIYGNGSNVRDWLYVEDHCEAIDLIIRKGKVGSSYNIGGNCELSNLELANLICSLMGELKPKNRPYSDLLTFVTDRPGHDWRYATSIEKIKTELGWEPGNSFTHNLMNTLSWYLERTEASLLV